MSNFARIILGCLLTVSTPVASPTPAIAGEGRTEAFAIQSIILREERTFEIYVPANPGHRSRVIYVLDGQAQFATVVKALKALGDTQHVVVGIGNIWMRDRDYTPTRVAPSAFVHANAAAVSGGAESFVTHLEREVFSHIEARFGQSERRVLVGHSLGGLLAVHILLSNPTLFDGHVVIDPSMWWDNARLLAIANERLAPGFPSVAVFLAIANSRNKDRTDVDAVRADQSEDSALIRPSVLLLDALRANPGNGITLNWRYYEDHDHMSVFAPALKDGLAFVLKQA